MRFSFSLGFRTMIGLLTLAVLVYFGLYVQAMGSTHLALVIYVLAGLRALLLVYDVVRKSRLERELARAIAAEEQEDARLAALARGPSPEGPPSGDDAVATSSAPETPDPA